MTSAPISGVVLRIEAREPDMRLLADQDLIDILRRHLCLQDEFVGFRRNQHEGLTRSDDAADRVKVQLVDKTGDRRADRGPLKARLRGDLALLEFGDAALDIAKLGQGLGALLVLDLDHLNVDFGDTALGARPLGNQPAALALKARLFALHGEDTAGRHEPILEEFLEVGELAADETDLGFLRLLLRGKPANLLVKLADLLP